MGQRYDIKLFLKKNTQILFYNKFKIYLCANINTHDMTILQFSEMHGKRPEAVYMKLRRSFPGIRFESGAILAAEHLQALQTDKRRSGSVQTKSRVQTSVKPANMPVEKKSVNVQNKKSESVPNVRNAVLVGLLLAPTAASVTNMFAVSESITGEPVTALLYTIVLACSALGFTVVGSRSWITVSLSLALIGYESFCNLSRLYFGLMGGVKGNPTRFLGTVTNLFDSGSHGTALAIAGFSALMLAAVQYAAIFELQKNK